MVSGREITFGLDSKLFWVRWKKKELARNASCRESGQVMSSMRSVATCVVVVYRFSLLFPSFSCFCLCPFKVLSHNAHASGVLMCSLPSLAQVEPMYDELLQQLVRKMPPRPFAVCGRDPADYSWKKLIPVSQKLDVAKQHPFYFATHPHFWNVFGCDNQEQVDEITKTSLAVMSSVAGRDIPFVEGFHNLKTPASSCV